MRHFPSTRFASSVEAPSGIHPGETLSAHDVLRPRASRPRALKLPVTCGIALIAATVLATGALVVHFRDHVLSDSERELTNTALILAETTDRTFKALELAQISLIERMKSLGIDSSEDLELCVPRTSSGVLREGRQEQVVL
jgi:hypothetical protein